MKMVDDNLPAWRKRKCPICGAEYESRATLCLKHWIDFMWGQLKPKTEKGVKESEVGK